ncbi:MAG: hypothetical protein ACTSPN_14335, partial [Promethearchaeota archaeon]
TLMGSQAEMLMKRLNRKRIGIDTIVLWLVFSKVAYEFAHNFPFSQMKPLVQWFPNIFLLTWLNSDWVNLIKNLLVLAFFLLTLLIIGFYEFSKYFKDQKKLAEKIEEHVSPKAVMEYLTPPTEEDLTVPQDLPKEEETPSPGDFSDSSEEIKETYQPEEDIEMPQEDSHENFKENNPENEDDGNNSSF